jgi:streptogramin lyase
MPKEEVMGINNLILRAGSLTFRCGLAAGLLLLMTNANSAVLQGVVKDTAGQPVDSVLVTVEDKRLSSTTISVLTNSQGKFEFPDLGVVSIPAKAVRMLKVGFTQRGPITIKPKGNRLLASITAAPVDNVAEQVSGSAWIARYLPDTPATHMMSLNCAQCHDLPFAKAKHYINMFGTLPVKEKEKVWFDVFKFMRVKSAGLNPSIDLSTLPPAMFERHPHAGAPGSDMVASWSHADEEVMAPLLAQYMPASFTEYKLDDYKKLLAPVGTVGTVFREYQMPAPIEGSLWHDTTIAKRADGKRFIYSMDWANPRIARIDPRTGEIRMLPLPKGVANGHTLAPDQDGKLVAVLQNPGSIGRYDPLTEKWEIWPAGGPAAGVHSFAYKAGYYVGYDATGGIWASLIAQNKLIRLDPRTGKTLTVDAPSTGEAPAQSMVYGGAMTADGKTVWFTQLNGYVFAVDTASGQVTEKIDIPRGDGPRRLTIDKDDVLYVPLDGAGRILVYDTKTKKEIGRFALPDWAAGPYAANWDPTRNAVWTVGRNGKVYRFNVADKSFIEYPFPRQVLVHALSVDNETGDVFFSYGGTPQIAWSPRMVAWLHPGEPETKTRVTLH